MVAIVTKKELKKTKLFKERKIVQTKKAKEEGTQIYTFLVKENKEIKIRAKGKVK